MTVTMDRLSCNLPRNDRNCEFPVVHGRPCGVLVGHCTSSHPIYSCSDLSHNKHSSDVEEPWATMEPLVVKHAPYSVESTKERRVNKMTELEGLGRMLTDANEANEERKLKIEAKLSTFSPSVASDNRLQYDSPTDSDSDLGSLGEDFQSKETSDSSLDEFEGNMSSSIDTDIIHSSEKSQALSSSGGVSGSVPSEARGSVVRYSSVNLSPSTGFKWTSADNIGCRRSPFVRPLSPISLDETMTSNGISGAEPQSTSCIPHNLCSRNHPHDRFLSIRDSPKSRTDIIYDRYNIRNILSPNAPVKRRLFEETANHTSGNSSFSDYQEEEDKEEEEEEEEEGEKEGEEKGGRGGMIQEEEEQSERDEGEEEGEEEVKEESSPIRPCAYAHLPNRQRRRALHNLMRCRNDSYYEFQSNQNLLVSPINNGFSGQVGDGRTIISPNAYLQRQQFGQTVDSYSKSGSLSFRNEQEEDDEEEEGTEEEDDMEEDKEEDDEEKEGTEEEKDETEEDEEEEEEGEKGDEEREEERHEGDGTEDEEEDEINDEDETKEKKEREEEQEGEYVLNTSIFIFGEREMSMSSNSDISDVSSIQQGQSFCFESDHDMNSLNMERETQRLDRMDTSGVVYGQFEVALYTSVDQDVSYPTTSTSTPLTFDRLGEYPPSRLIRSNVFGGQIELCLQTD